MAIASINPATGVTIKHFDEHTAPEIEAKLQLAVRAFEAHKRSSFKSRAEKLNRAADILDNEKRAFGQLMTEEMGKTLKSAIAEAEKCAVGCRHYAEHGEAYLRDEPLPSAAQSSYLRYLPQGPVFAIMPWNFPFWQVIRFAAPTLMAGNVGLLKHASNVPRSALALDDLFRRAGFAEGCFQTLLIGNSRVAAIIEDKRIRAVTLTGSEGAGVQVAQNSGRALKRTVLELGGSDPFIVMPSANLEHAAETATVARNINNGQSCIAAKRFIVHASVYSQFESLLVARLKTLKMGDPMREDTDIGPLATPDGLKTIIEQVDQSVAAGAKLLVGGKAPGGPGNFYPATALGEIPKTAPAYRDEVFGPVALLFKVANIDEAIALANDSDFGLGSSAWTNDPAEQERFANEIEAGMTFINSMVVSDPRLPFGGVKHSGYGRELGAFGIREFMNAKTVSVSTGKPKLSHSE